jgi:hypothetical protein
MIYETKIYWGFALCPSSGILKTKEHNVSKTRPVSPVSETSCSLASRIPDDEQNPKTPVILNTYLN